MGQPVWTPNPQRASRKKANQKIFTQIPYRLLYNCPCLFPDPIFSKLDTNSPPGLKDAWQSAVLAAVPGMFEPSFYTHNIKSYRWKEDIHTPLGTLTSWNPKSWSWMVFKWFCRFLFQNLKLKLIFSFAVRPSFEKGCINPWDFPAFDAPSPQQTWGVWNRCSVPRFVLQLGESTKKPWDLIKWDNRWSITALQEFPKSEPKHLGFHCYVSIVPTVLGPEIRRIPQLQVSPFLYFFSYPWGPIFTSLFFGALVSSSQSWKNKP